MKSTERRATTRGHHRRIAGRAQKEGIDDPYARRAKPSDPTVCPHCGAVFQGGRWQWTQPPADAGRELCPACQRVRDDYPAGIVELSGSFVMTHLDEIRALVRHQEEAEKAEHPLNRIMRVRDLPEGLEIATTDIHLPRRIGEALRRAYHGDLDLSYVEEGYFLRLRWSRDDPP
jgi:NMD protein affecting ribosome stability and mRNA decay